MQLTTRFFVLYHTSYVLIIFQQKLFRVTTDYRLQQSYVLLCEDHGKFRASYCKG